MTATDHNDATGEKSTETAAIQKSYPDEWRGVRLGVEPIQLFGFIDSGWFHAELDNYREDTDSILSVDVRYQEAAPDAVDDVTFAIEHEDRVGELEAAASVDPDTAVELALSILDEVNGQL